MGVLVAGSSFFSAALAAEKKSYVTTTIRGALTLPGSGKPMSGAMIRFTPTDPDLSRATAVTDEEGRFAVEGLGFGNYVVEIETPDGETIRGVNALPVEENRPVVLELKMTERVRSSTSLQNEPERFMAVVVKERTKTGRFWKQFAIFWGVAIASAAAVF
jgi:hypothetical protein